MSPGFAPELVAAARAVRYPLLPGIMTPSELMAARLAGFTALKLFPAQQAGGIGMLKALGAPFPDVVFCPTGGITRARARPTTWRCPTSPASAARGSRPPTGWPRSDWSAIEQLAREAAALRSR